MAINFSKFNFFNRLDARGRVFFLLGVLVSVVVLVYLATVFFSGGSTTGQSSVATAPQGIQSVPGGTLTPEYQRALQQANLQSKQAAEITGSSAISTIIRTNDVQGGCIICSDQSANIKNNLDDWIRKGNIAPDVASALQALADKNVPVEDFADELARLVKEGKLTPEQARLLLEQYKKQHANKMIGDSAKFMDGLIKSGQLPLDVANALLAAQKSGASICDYADELQDLVTQGRVSSSTSQQLLSQYTQLKSNEIITRSISTLRRMSRQGQLTADVLNELIALETQMVPLDTFSATLNKDVTAGKLTPAVSAKILEEYNAQKMQMTCQSTVNDLLQQALAAAYQEINDLLKSGKITADVASQLTNAIQKNISLEDYQNLLMQLVQQNKLTPDIAKLKYADYQKIKALQGLLDKLGALQKNNAASSDYSDALKQAVADGLLTPDQAAELMRQFLALRAQPAPQGQAATSAFAELQKNVAGAQPAGPTAGAFAAPAQPEAETTSPEEDQAKQARIQALLTAMSGQAQQLITAWTPVTMVHRESAPAATKTTETTKKTTTTSGKDGKGAQGMGATGPILIKGGSIYFAVLDTAANSDYPDSPILATVVAGPFKGAKLLGKLVTTKGVAGQMDRISLNFTLMNMDAWPKSRDINAYAIDPDTARTVMASSVNYHYLKRFGAIMATSFLQGYATAITNEGTSTTGIFGTSTSHPSLSPASKIAVGLGQVGQTLGSLTQNYINIPPTVKVDSGVGLGILFTKDVT